MFTAREQELTDIHAALWDGKAAAVTAVKGLGGVGKSTLARAYTDRFGDEYEGIWWVRAEKPETLLADLGALAERLDPTLAGQAASVQAQEALRRVATSSADKPWLIVLDNLAAPETARTWRAERRAQTLITTRFQALAGVAPIEVRRLSDQEAARLLLLASGSSDHAGALTLAHRLGGLPLALKHAGAYLREHPTLTFAEYERNLVELVQRLPEGADYPATVAATFDQAIKAADKAAPGAKKLMALISFYAPDDIPLRLLEGAKPLLGGDLAFVEGVDALWRYSLLERSVDNGETMLSVHRLVQECMRNSLSAGESRDFAEAGATNLAAAFEGDPGDVRTWSRSGPLAPHVIALSAAMPSDVASPELADALGYADQFFDARGDYATAEALSRRALDIDEAVFGATHSSVATRLNNLAQLLQTTKRTAEAEPLMRRALAIDEANLGTDHPNVATRLNNLGGLLRETERLGQAEPLMRRALAIDETHFGPNHPSVAIRLNNLAQLLLSTGRFAEADPLARRALAIDEASFGPNHPRVANRLNNLAGLLWEIDRRAEAEPLMSRAHDIFAASLGLDHPNTCAVAANLIGIRAELAIDSQTALSARARGSQRSALGKPPNAGRLARTVDLILKALRARRP